MSIALSHLFETPLIVDTLPGAEAVNAAVRPILASLGSGRHEAGRIAWDAPGQTALRAVVDHVRGLGHRFTQDAASPDRSRFDWQARLWVQVAGRNDRLDPLRQYDAYWIADYYVDDGFAGSSDRGLGGEVLVEDPRLPLPMAELPDLRIRGSLGADAMPYEPEIQLRPATGRILAYPGWLRVQRRPLLTTTPSYWLTIALVAVRRA